MAAVYAIVRARQRDRALALCAALLLAAPWFVVTWAPLGRVDMLACFFLGVFTKQTALLAPAATALSLLGEPVPRRLRAFLATRGQAWTHLVTYTAAADYSVAALVKGCVEFLVLSGPLLAVILLGLGACPDVLLSGPDLRFSLYAGPILSENLSVLVRKGKPVLVEPFGMLLLSRRGLWRPDRVVADCQARRFALVVEEHRLREIPGLAACLDRRYEEFNRLGPHDLLRPRPDPPP